MLCMREIYPTFLLRPRSRTGMRAFLRRRNSVEEWFASRRPCRAQPPSVRCARAAFVKVGDARRARATNYVT